MVSRPTTSLHSLPRSAAEIHEMRCRFSGDDLHSPLSGFSTSGYLLISSVDNYLICLDVSATLFIIIQDNQEKRRPGMGPSSGSSAVELRGITTGYVHEHLAKSEAQALTSPDTTTRAMAIHGLGPEKV